MAKTLKKVLRGQSTLAFRILSTSTRDTFDKPLTEVEMEISNDDDGVIQPLTRFTLNEGASFEMDFSGKTEELVN